MPRTLDDVHWPRPTKRLELRRLEPADAPLLFAYRCDPEVSRWLTSQPNDLAAFAAGFQSWIDSNLAIIRDGELIGDAMIRLQDSWAQEEVREAARGTAAELGWCLSPSGQGQGFATETVRELLGIAFEDLGVHRVEACCFADNRASWHIMEKVGMRRERYAVRESLHRDGSWHDGITYAMLAEEWPG